METRQHQINLVMGFTPSYKDWRRGDLMLLLKFLD